VGTSGTFFSGLTQAFIQSGGANIDTNGQDITIAQPLLNGGGGGGLTLYGSGRLTLMGSNTYTGRTTISAGVLSIASTAALPGWSAGGRYSVDNGAALAVGDAITDANITTMLSSGNFVNGAAVGFDTSAGNRTYGLNLANSSSGAIGLVIVGPDTLTLSGTNTYTGGTIVEAGTLDVISGSALPKGGSLTIGAGGTFVFNPSAAGAPLAASFDPTVSPVPEPSSFALLGVSAIGLLAYAWRRRRQMA
jgi:autotransporter-associated beta strand protein